MDRERLQRIIAELDEEVPKDGARVRFVQYGGGPDESKAEANETGYLRLGIEFLKAAFAPETKGSVDADIRYLLDDYSDVRIDWFERRDDFPPTQPASEMSHVVGIVIAIVLLITFLTGVATVLIGLWRFVAWLLS